MLAKTSLQKFIRRLFSSLPFPLQQYIKNNLNIVRKLDYEKKDIFIYVDSPVEYEFRLKSCYHEPGTIRWIEEYIKKDEIVFDIGANIGAFSLVIAKYNNGSNRIFSFEPNFTSYNKLCKNIILNHCEDCIFPFPIALSKKYGVDTLNYSSLEIGSAYHTLGVNKFLKDEPKYKQQTIVYSVDKFIDDFNVQNPQHIKIDVDGMEYEILKGAKKTISRTNFRSLNVEIDENSEDCEKIIEYIKSLGLIFRGKYTDLNAGDPKTNDFKIYNYIFTK